MNSTLYPRSPVLVVDDEPLVLALFESALRASGVNHVFTFQDSRKVTPFLAEHSAAVVLMDLSMPYLNGEELMSMVAAQYPDVPIVVVTGANDVETAVRCMKTGALDYLVKPVEESRLTACVRRIVELRDLEQENLLLRRSLLSEKVSNPEAFEELVTTNPKMYRLFQYIDAIAVTPHPVLITGETGAGKELFARAVHRASGRTGLFVPVNIAGLDDNLFSDMLFGHQKGAFTSAEESRPGVIETAVHGTLFLDEIGELSHASQIKLLRLIQEREYFPLGSTAPRRCNARIVVATHRDVEVLRDAGQLRADLYYRLSTHQIHVPPLRERREDLPLLVSHFTEKAANTVGRPAPSIPSELLDMLTGYDFPGNVRELEAMMVDAVSMNRSGVLPIDSFRARLGTHGTAPSPEKQVLNLAPFLAGQPFPTLCETTQFLITEAMRLAKDNQSVAARLLGISRPALNRRLRHPKNEEGENEDL